MKKWVLNVDANATDFEPYERGGLTPYGDGYSYQGSGYSDGVSGLTDGNGVGAGAGCEIGEADGYGDSHSFATSDLAWSLMER